MTSLTNVENPVGHALSSRARRARWFCGLILAALSLGSFELGEKGLWLDEIASLNFALGGPEVWFADHNMSLYYALLAGVMKLFGRSEVALRGLSVLCFVAASALVYELGTRLFGERAGRSASLLFVLNAAVVHFAQEARGYLLALALVSASSLLLARLFELSAEDARRRWLLALGYGVLAGLALYAHLFAVWVALAQALVALWLCARRAADVRPLLLGFALLGLCALPLGLGVLERGTGQISWILPPTPGRIWAGLVLLSGGSAALALLEAALFALFAFTLLRAPSWLVRPAQRARAGAPQLVLAWCLVPALVSYTFSRLVSPITHPKYLLVSVPALLLGVAAGIDRLKAARLRAALLGALLLLSCGRLYVWFAQQQRELWREAVELLAARARPDDVLVLDVMLAEPLDYYVERLGCAARLPRLIALAREPGRFDVRPPQGWGLPPPPERPLAPDALRAALASAPRVWWLQNRSAAFDAPRWLGATHRAREQLAFEPRDDEGKPLFADPRGRIITLRLFTRADVGLPRESTTGAEAL